MACGVIYDLPWVCRGCWVGDAGRSLGSPGLMLPVPLLAFSGDGGLWGPGLFLCCLAGVCEPFVGDCMCLHGILW